MKKLLWTIMAGCIALYVFVSFGQAAQKPAAIPKKTPELLSQGKKNYEQTCAACHGAKGDGKGPAGLALKPPPNDFKKPLREWPITKGDPRKIFEVISKGVPNSSMVGWTQFSEQERWGLVYAVMEFAAPAKKK